jgi:hypothetical protein
MSWINAVAVRHLALVHARAIPLTRGECVGGPRPCQYETCKYHLDGADSCLLDLIDKHPDGMSDEEIGGVLGITKQAVQFVGDRALTKIGLHPRRRQALKQFAEP